MDEESEYYIQLIKAGEDSSEFLQATKQSLNFIALFIYFSAIPQGNTRFAFRGATGIIPRSSSNCRAQLLRTLYR
ncbi:hypothetical protein ABO04_07190 [Nitrosomonas sp. HPC101]|nr:hypothetical protein [Nitrosomonas sp. HPC101]